MAGVHGLKASSKTGVYRQMQREVDLELLDLLRAVDRDRAGPACPSEHGTDGAAAAGSSTPSCAGEASLCADEDLVGDVLSADGALSTDSEDEEGLIRDIIPECLCDNRLHSVSDEDTCSSSDDEAPPASWEVQPIRRVLKPSPEEELRSNLRAWAINFNVPLTTVRPLLRLLNPLIPSLPKAEQTLLKTAPVTGTREMGQGEYFYFGIKSRLVQVLKYFRSPILDINFNCDGLPIFKSSGTECWPIMGLVKGSCTPPFVCAVWCGKGKPPAQEYLHDFVTELKPLMDYGFDHDGCFYQVNVSGFICDSPAKALMKGVILHSGYYSCCYCTTPGRWKGRVIFPDTKAALRTDDSFRSMAQPQHHVADSPLLSLDIDMITAFPLDYQHLMCLGVGRKLLIRVVSGQKKVGGSLVTDGGIARINKRLLAAVRFWARDFSRRPRILEELKRWKATEFRQFLLYLIPVILRGTVLPEKALELFLLLHIAMTIMTSEDLLSQYDKVAEQALLQFVNKAKSYLKAEFMVHNVHNLIHIVPHCRLFGTVDNFSAFPFENELSVLKRAVRGSSKVLQQIVNRIKERHETILQPRKKVLPEGSVSQPCRKKRWTLHLRGESFKRLHIKGRQVSLLRGDNFVKMDTGGFVMVHNIMQTADGVFIVGQQFRVCSDLYTSPVKSSSLGVYKVEKLSLRMNAWPVNEIECKVLAVAFEKSTRSAFGVFPLLQK